MKDGFPASILHRLDYYVYLYIDPRDGSIFYVGKGKKNRAFAHLSTKSEKQMVRQIHEIRSKRLEPRIDILVHGVDEKTARKIEASVIDLIGIDKLTNLQKGYDSKEHGRMSIKQIVATYTSVRASILEPSILININKSFHFGISQIELYDATRSAWRIGTHRRDARYAFAVYQGIIQEVYEIMDWYPNNSTLNSRKTRDSDNRKNRWEFVGRIADDSIRKTYIYKTVDKMRYPIRYVKC